MSVHMYIHICMPPESFPQIRSLRRARPPPPLPWSWEAVWASSRSSAEVELQFLRARNARALENESWDSMLQVVWCRTSRGFENSLLPAFFDRGFMLGTRVEQRTEVCMFSFRWVLATTATQERLTSFGHPHRFNVLLTIPAPAEPLT